MSYPEIQSIAAELVVDDVADDVRAAFESAKTIEGEAKDITDPAEVVETESAKAERLRNERGQFIKAEEGAEKTAAEPQKVPDADQNREQPVERSSANEPPSFLSAEAKAEWAKAPSAIQAALLKRDADANEGGRRWSEEKRAYDETLAPVMEAAQRAGVDPREGIKRLTAANAYLDRDPPNAIKWLAQAYGVDLKALASDQQQPQQPKADPLVAQLHQDVGYIKSSLAEQAKAQTTQAIQAFASSPGHEHFEDVKVKMGQLLLTRQATDLQDAYDQATWSNPSVRAKLIAAQTAPVAAAAKDQAIVTKARRGAISPRGTPASAVPEPQKAPARVNGADSVEDDVRAAFRQHAG